MKCETLIPSPRNVMQKFRETLGKQVSFTSSQVVQVHAMRIGADPRANVVTCGRALLSSLLFGIFFKM